MVDGKLRRKLEAALSGDGWEINAAAVRFAMTNGAAIPGARMVKWNHVRVRLRCDQPVGQRRVIRAKMIPMKTIPIPRRKNRKPKKDPHYPAAVERAKEAARQLQEKGIIDAEGRRVRKDLPSDMREGQDRDFGG